MKGGLSNKRGVALNIVGLVLWAGMLLISRLLFLMFNFCTPEVYSLLIFPHTINGLLIVGIGIAVRLLAKRKSNSQRPWLIAIIGSAICITLECFYLYYNSNIIQAFMGNAVRQSTLIAELPYEEWVSELHVARWLLPCFSVVFVLTVITSCFLRKKSNTPKLIIMISACFIGTFIAFLLAGGFLGFPEVGVISLVAIFSAQPLMILLPALDIPIKFTFQRKTHTMNFNTNTEKSKVVAAVLAFFFGGLGVHRYYLGYIKQGFTQTVGGISLIFGCSLATTGAMENSTGLMIISLIFLGYALYTGIYVIIDFIHILTGRLLPADGACYSENHTANNDADMLEKLAKLHEQGILTDDEYQQKKEEILKRI